VASDFTVNCFIEGQLTRLKKIREERRRIIDGLIALSKKYGLNIPLED